MSESSDNRPLIVFFHPYFSDGGVERTNIGLAKELIKRGYRVSFVTINPSYHFIDEVNELGIEFVVLKAKTTLASQPALLMWLRKKAREVGPIIVVSCQYYVNVLCVLFRPLWGAGVRHVLSERNHLDEFKINQHGFKQKLIRWLVPILYRYADTVVANSSELAKDLEELTGRAVAVIYNPTINPRLSRLAMEEVSEEWYLKASRPIMLAVGRLSKQKDYETLIRAFAKLRDTHNATLVILGDGSEKPRLDRLIADRQLQSCVIMPGFVGNPYKFMRSADLFVLSSVYEGLPNVLIEALSLRTPVISTSCRSGPAEILENGRYGALVPVGDDEAMCVAMRWVLDHRHEASLKARSAADSLKMYTPEHVGDELVELIGKLTSRNEDKLRVGTS